MTLNKTPPSYKNNISNNNNNKVFSFKCKLINLTCCYHLKNYSFAYN